MNEKPSLTHVQAALAEAARWAHLQVSLEEIADDVKPLVRDLSTFDPIETVPLLSGLLTQSEYQWHCIRLELLSALALVHCRGRKRPRIEDANRWFCSLGESRCVSGEEPAEDVFVSLVYDQQADYRILRGCWQDAGFYTQIILDVVATMPDEGPFGQIKRSTQALLAVSDIVCGKAGLGRYEVGAEQHHATLAQEHLPSRDDLIGRATVPLAELAALGVTPLDLEPFILTSQMKSALVGQEAAYSYLDRHPLALLGNGDLTVARPSSLSVAARDYVIACVLTDEPCTDAFDVQLAKAYLRRVSETPFFESAPTVPWRKRGAYHIAHSGVRVDQGHHLVCHLVLPTVRTHVDGGFGGCHLLDGALREELRSSADEVARGLACQPDFKGGVLLLAICGWGRECEMPDLEWEADGWRVQSASAADLVRLEQINGVGAKYLWRFLDGLDAATSAGLEFPIRGDLLNLMAWMRSNEGHFIPHSDLDLPERVSSDSPLLCHVAPDVGRSLRAEALTERNLHHSLDNAGRRHQLMRAPPDGEFLCASSRRVYASVDSVSRGELVAVYEGGSHLWVSVDTPNIPDTEVQYHLWRMTTGWLHRVGTALDQRLTASTEPEKLMVYVEFHDVDPSQMIGERPQPGHLASLCRIEEHGEKNACKVIFDVGFLRGASLAENIAERLLVRTLARAYLRLLDVDNEDADARKLEAAIVPNNDARSFHIFQTHDYRDYVRASLPGELVEIDAVDDAAARIGLAWRVVPAPEAMRIEGRRDCTSFLASLVDTQAGELLEALRSFNRASALRRLIYNCEKADAEESHWRRTSAALLGLHGDGSETVGQVINRLSDFAGARSASRILIEMALCESSLEGGATLSDLEMSKLIARAALVISIGGLSDAIHLNVLSPEITISPLGDVLFRDEFGALVARPMMARMLGDRVIADAPRQKRNYEDPRTIEREAAEIADEFLEIWKAEMGFDLKEVAPILEALQEKGVAEGNAVLELTQDEFFQLACADGLPESAAASFLSQFCLATRPSWTRPPSDFDIKDIYPWRFGRRLSFMTRPILRLDDSTNPRLMIAPGALSSSIIYVFEGARLGRLDRSFFRTRRMKDSWLGKAREGHTFNGKVAQGLSQADWNVRENIGLPEVFNRHLERNWGDVDVLAWKEGRNEILAVESKDLAPARNLSEIASLLSEYQGAESGGKPDKLRKHLNRVALLGENLECVQRFTGVPAPKIVSCLVCSSVVPMQYARIEALSDTKVGTLEEVLALVC